MRVLYDNVAFDVQAFGGVSKCFCELVRNLPEDVEPVVPVLSTNNVYYCEMYPEARKNVRSFETFLPKLKFRGKARVYKVLHKMAPKLFPDFRDANHQAFVKALENEKYDLIHLTSPHSYTGEWRKYVGRVPIVITVHDLIPELLQGDKKVEKDRAEVLRLVDRVIAVSHHTKQDLIDHYHISPDKVDVVYHGPSFTTQDTAKSREERNLEALRNGYVLYIGRRGGYKRFDLLVEAVSLLRKENISVDVVCTGSSFSPKEKLLLQKFGVENQFRTVFVQDNEWQEVFSRALVFVYPSEYEGFGIPIVDAFQSGCPVILSQSSCFPEIGGDAALYFKPGDSVDLYCCLKRLIEDQGLRDELKGLGLKLGKEFSWKKGAMEVAAIYKKAIGNG